MNVRPDVAALLRRGHTDSYIASQTGYHRTTVARARRALKIPPGQILGHVYAEAVPTGRVTAPVGRLPLSPAQQAANRARLLAALKSAA
jgi:hypothetical protein